jgi:hypothetical protein
VHVNVRIGEGTEPAAVELDASGLSLTAQSTWRLKDDILCEHFSKAVQIVGIEGFCAPLERLACRPRHLNSPWPVLLWPKNSVYDIQFLAAWNNRYRRCRRRKLA